MPIPISSLPPPLIMDQETSSRIPMAKAAKIIRNSVHTFLQNYQYFTSISAILALPFSISFLLSQSSNSLLPTIYNRLTALFLAAGFFSSPDSSDFFSILCLKLSQTVSSSISILPFTLTFLLITKSSVIQFLIRPKKKPSFPLSFSSVFSILNSLFLTYICNSFLILSANATVFSILFFTLNFLESFGFSSSSSSSSPTFFLFLSAAGAVLYSIILANALIICNLSLVLSGIERSGGYLAIIKSCVLIRGRALTALSLALPVNLAMAGIEALFQYRIVRAHHSGENEKNPTALLLGLEGLLIAYLYSILIVVDTIVSCIFYKSCNSSSLMEDQERNGFAYRIAIAEGKDGGGYVNLMILEDLP